MNNGLCLGVWLMNLFVCSGVVQTWGSKTMIKNQKPGGEPSQHFIGFGAMVGRTEQIATTHAALDILKRCCLEYTGVKFEFGHSVQDQSPGGCLLRFRIWILNRETGDPPVTERRLKWVRCVICFYRSRDRKLQILGISISIALMDSSQGVLMHAYPTSSSTTKYHVGKKTAMKFTSSWT